MCPGIPAFHTPSPLSITCNYICGALASTSRLQHVLLERFHWPNNIHCTSQTSLGPRSGDHMLVSFPDLDPLISTMRVVSQSHTHFLPGRKWVWLCETTMRARSLQSRMLRCSLVSRARPTVAVRDRLV